MDFSEISEVIGLASSAVGLTGKAAATISAIKAVIEKDKPTGNGETEKLLNTLAGELTAANMMNVQLSEALKSLSQQLRKEDEFEREKARYELFQTGQGDIVFRLKEPERNGQPIHFICPVCLNSEKIISFVTGEGDYKICQRDGNHVFRFNSTSIGRVGRARTDFDPFA